MFTHTIIEGNCLEEVKNLSNIHLIISSPPYFNAKKYNAEIENVGNNKDYGDYIEKIDGLIADMMKALVPGGYICWNTSPVLDNGKRIGIPFDLHQLFILNGFDFLEDIVWKKPDGAAKLRCGGWCQNKNRPTTWHGNIVTEYIMIYQKPGKREYRQFKESAFAGHDKDILTNVWFIQPETATKWHDAPYPAELVKRLMLLYSFEGDTVLDPFGGSLTTTKVASENKRNSISIELSKDYIEKGMKQRFEESSLFDKDFTIVVKSKEVATNGI